MRTPRLVRQKQILRLHIPMNNILRMHVNQGARHLPHDPRRLLLRQRSLLHHVVEQFAPAHQFHDDVDLILRDEHVEELDDVGMLEVAQRFDFRVELVHHVLELRIDFGFVNDFARAGRPRGQFDAAVARGGRSDSEDFAELVLLVKFRLSIRSIVYLSRRQLPHPSIRPPSSILLLVHKHGARLLLQPAVLRAPNRIHPLVLSCPHPSEAPPAALLLLPRIPAIIVILLHGCIADATYGLRRVRQGSAEAAILVEMAAAVVATVRCQAVTAAVPGGGGGSALRRTEEAGEAGGSRALLRFDALPKVIGECISALAATHSLLLDVYIVLG
mmetsp:Transcript_36925/g.89049  ORF Transcript_36925/g.89049 Transcript_36925/m.89049 type:complete len:330 (+) Transcript_36925:833-1822(+)